MEQQKKIKLLKKYANEIKTSSFQFYIKGNIPSKKIDNAIQKFANNVDRTSIIGMYDTTVFDSGKQGYVFTDTKVYYLTFLEKPKKLWYDDILSVEVIPTGKKDCDNKLKFTLYDGQVVEWADNFVNKTPLCNFFREMIALLDVPDVDSIPSLSYDEKRFEGAVAGGVASGAYGQVNKSYDEEKFHAQQGHGFAAERANDFSRNIL